MAQRFSTLVHAAKDDLDAVWRAQAPDPTMLILALDVAWLILIPARPAPGLLHGGESPGVGEPQPGPGTLEPPKGAERRRERSQGALCDFCVELNLSKPRLPDQCREGAWEEKVLGARKALEGQAIGKYLEATLDASLTPRFEKLSP